VSRARLTSTAGYALALVALTNTMSLLDRNILAILNPRIKHDIGIGDAEMGLLYGTVFALFYALFSLPIGRLADGWVRTRLLGITLAFWSVATALAAAAHGFALLAISRLGVGIGEGSAQPAGISLVMDHYAKPRRGFAMAVIAAAIALGLGGSSVLGGVAADWWDRLHGGGAAPLGLKGWQFAFLVAAAPGLILAVLLWRMPEPQRGRLDGIESPPDPHPFRASLALLGAVTPGPNWLALAGRRASARYWGVNLSATLLVIAAAMALTRITSALSPRPPLHLGSLAVSPHVLQWSVVGFGALVIVNLLQRLSLADRPAFEVIRRSPTLLLCLGIAALQMMINYGTMGFTPSFLMKHYGLSPAATGLQFGVLAGALGIVGPMIAGPLSDHINVRYPGVGRACVTLVSLGVSPLIAIWVYHAPDPASFYLRFVLYSLVLTAWYPPLYAIMFEQVLPRMRGITASLYIMVYTLFGIGIGPFLVGMIADANGGDLATAILAINWVAPAIVVMLIALTLRVRRDEAGLIERARRGGEVLSAPQPAAGS
jgi:MFS transporter, Spinster family, sphingosine-1-phosphate transporter